MNMNKWQVTYEPPVTPSLSEAACEDFHITRQVAAKLKR